MANSHAMLVIRTIHPVVAKMPEHECGSKYRQPGANNNARGNQCN